MVRVLVGSFAAGESGDPDAAADDRTRPVARRLRDGGHEVVLVGPGVSPSQLAQAAIQEDVVAINLVAGDVDDGGHGADELVDLLASYGAGDIVVFEADWFTGGEAPGLTGAIAQD